MKGVTKFICAASCLCSIQVAYSVQELKIVDNDNVKNNFPNDPTNLTELEKIIIGLKYPFIGPVSKAVSPALSYGGKLTDNISRNSKSPSTEVPERITVFSDDNGNDLPELMNALTSLLQTLSSTQSKIFKSASKSYPQSVASEAN